MHLGFYELIYTIIFYHNLIILFFALEINQKYNHIDKFKLKKKVENWVGLN